MKSSTLINKLTNQFDDELTQITAGLSFERSAFFVGLSGGVDSCALLKLLMDSCEGKGVDVYALHFNHQLQGDSSKWRDFCQKYAQKIGCDFYSTDWDVDIDKKQGLESSARKARYSWFNSIIEQVCRDKGYESAALFTGHHANDQAETVLMNILRGTGINGLRGIARLQERLVDASFSYNLIRPLLGFTKAQLLSYMESCDEPWIEDQSNQDTKFRRNAIRQKVLPPLEEIRPDASLQFVKLSEKAVDIESILFDMAAMDLGLVSEHYDFCVLDYSYGLNLKNLHVLSVPRQINALKYWLESVGYPANSEMDLLTMIEWSMNDATAGAELQRNERIYRYYRGVIYVMPNKIDKPKFTAPLVWGNVNQELNLSEYFEGLIVSLCVDTKELDSQSEALSDLTVMPRKLADNLKLKNSQSHINTKNLLQEYGVPAWRRDQALFIANRHEECIAVVGGQKVGAFSLKMQRKSD